MADGNDAGCQVGRICQSEHLFLPITVTNSYATCTSSSAPLNSTMAPLSAISGSRPHSAQQILDDIEAQFQLDDNALTAITSQFLKEVETGLSDYNHPMAMMCVSFSLNDTLSNVCELAPRSSLVFRTAPRQGQWFNFIPIFNVSPIIEHSWLLILGEPTCKILHAQPYSVTAQGFPYRRVCEVELHGNKTFTLRQQKYRLSDQLKTGEAKALFGAHYFKQSSIHLLTLYRLSRGLGRRFSDIIGFNRLVTRRRGTTSRPHLLFPSGADSPG